MEISLKSETLLHPSDVTSPFFPLFFVQFFIFYFASSGNALIDLGVHNALVVTATFDRNCDIAIVLNHNLCTSLFAG